MNQRLAIALIWSLIIADLLTGLFYNLTFGFYRIGLVVKSIIIFFVGIFYLTQLKKKSPRSLYLAMLILSGIWLIGSFISFVINPDFSYSYSLIVLNRYFFFMILACIFLDVSADESFELQCNKMIDGFFILNNSLILIGFFFHVQLFSTFDPLGEYDGERFGYKGLIFGGNDVAGIYLLGIAHYFRKSFSYKEGSTWLLAMTCFSGMLSGTKAIFLAVILFGSYFFIKYRIRSFVALIVPVVIFVSYYIYSHWRIIKDDYLARTVQLYNELDLIGFLTTGRNKYLEKNFKIIASDWTIVNFFSGDAFLYAEMDFFDLYFFFGVGAFLYIYVYVRIFFIRDKSPDNLFVFAVLMSAAFVAGHFIQSAAVPLFLLLYIFSAKRRTLL